MRLKRLEIAGFKSFAKKAVFSFDASISSIVGPNGSGKSNIAESIRFVLGEQSMKSMRGKRGEDLIWNGSQTAPRANHASVSIVFDNSSRSFDIDFDEVSIRRDVHRDGTNEYYLNGTQVRLRDIFELLSKVHIGASGHHIISQGEADRILSANPKDRKIMVEEALGLKIYQWKIEESKKKLEKTEENIKQAESLRRELAPHLKFLKKQVERIEEAQTLKDELKDKYREYLKLESLYLISETKRVDSALHAPKEELQQIERDIEKARASLEKTGEDPKTEKLLSFEKELSLIRNEKDLLSREAGKLEGQIIAEKKRKERERGDGVIPVSSVRALAEEIEQELKRGERGEASVWQNIRNLFKAFFSGAGNGGGEEESDLPSLEREMKSVEEKRNTLSSREQELFVSVDALRKEIEGEKDKTRAWEKKVFELLNKKTELTERIRSLSAEKELLTRGKEAFDAELREGAVLVGRDILSYSSAEFALDPEEPRTKQEERRKIIEKMKIRLEERGVGNGDEIVKEYNETNERDLFLLREMEDLEKSKGALVDLIAELSEKINVLFKNGIEKINKQFQEFFALMFGGGNASLSVTKEKKRKRIEIGEDGEPIEIEADDEEVEEGVEINVSLPRKKIRGLVMLSGGERALTSIALIFAVSQVNPPPFLVLDETDAALDEANSRKYGDMLENLSRSSQLIVVTHNRETMSRAGLLYGVTMGSDAVSKLLSVRFEEASQFAK